jgi:predicted Rossmann-fold nucleotide-binding protein
LLNLNGFYDHLLKQLDVMVEEGFLKAENRNLVIESDNIEDLMEKISKFKASFHKKWMKREQI